MIPREYSRDPGSPSYPITILAQFGAYTLWEGDDVIGLDDDDGHEPRGFYMVHRNHLFETLLLPCGHAVRQGQYYTRWEDGQRLCLWCTERLIVEEER